MCFSLPETYVMKPSHFILSSSVNLGELLLTKNLSAFVSLMSKFKFFDV